MISTNLKKQPIGVFDSGIGGLTSVKELIRILPYEDIVYFGDTARVPYGSRNAETIITFAQQDLKFLLSKNVKAVLVACGTASATSLPVLKKMTDIPVVGVIDPASETAVNGTRNHKIAVLATQASINSHAYLRKITEIGKNTGRNFDVMEKACHLFVPLVENGFTDKDHPIVKAVINEYLNEVVEFGADTVILGCTHYPLLKDAIQNYIPDIRIVEAGKEAAKSLASQLDESVRNDCGGKREYYVSEMTSSFQETCEMFVGEKVLQTPHLVHLG